jgi:hypothetical protein
MQRRKHPNQVNFHLFSVVRKVLQRTYSRTPVLSLQDARCEARPHKMLNPMAEDMKHIRAVKTVIHSL